MTTIEDGVPIPEGETLEAPAAEEKPRRKPRARRKAEEKANPAASLLAALKFVAVAQKKNGPPGHQFCFMSGGWLAASDGILTVATPVAEDLNACPHTLRFINALSKTGEELSVTQLSANALAVKSGRFMALVPCANADEVPITGPDPQCAQLDDNVKRALGDVAVLATEGSPVAHYAAVLLQAGTAVATNGFAMLESWHGVDLPPGLLLPKQAATAIAKCGKPLTGFGFSNNSATFYFEDGSFIKTQLYAERYPAYEKVFECENIHAWAIPAEFFKAVRALESFSSNGVVYFNEGVISTDVEVEQASTYKIEGLPDGMAFNAKYLMQVESFFEKAHFENDEKPRVFFFGGNVRGVLMGVGKVEKQAPSVSSNSEEDDFSDDIPF